MDILQFILGVIVGFFAWTALLGVVVIRLPIMNRYYRHNNTKRLPMFVAFMPAVLIVLILVVPSFIWPLFFYGQLTGLLLNFANWKNIVKENHKSLISEEPGMSEFIKK